MIEHVYHKDLAHLHVGCEAPRAYYIPYADAETARTFARAQSPFFQNLCGEWDFRYYETFEDLDETFPAEPTDSRMTVPLCWQVTQREGMDVPLYSNLKYPFPLDPPHVPQENPCGAYLHRFVWHRDPEACLVVEDARAGIDAVKAGGMKAAGLGEAAAYERTDYPLKSFSELLKVCV